MVLKQRVLYLLTTGLLFWKKEETLEESIPEAKPTVAGELLKGKSLLDDGDTTQEEYKKIKQKILN